MQVWALSLLLGLAALIVVVEVVSAPVEWLWPYQLKGNTHWHGQGSANCVSLTFDDGPSRYTETVLEILKEHEIAATFFVMGIQVARYPEIIKRMADEGHEIGNHTYSFQAKKGLVRGPNGARIVATGQQTRSPSGYRSAALSGPEGRR